MHTSNVGVHVARHGSLAAKRGAVDVSKGCSPTCGSHGLRLGQVEQLGGGQHAAAAAGGPAVQVRALRKRLVEQHLHRVVVVDACASRGTPSDMSD